MAEEERRPPPSLVLVLCPERSGSTLLSMMLGRHPRVLAPPELHLLRYPDVDTWRRSYPEAMASLAWLAGRLGLPEAAARGGAVAQAAALERRFGGRDVAAVYAELLARLPPGGVLVDKTPAYARDDAALARAERLLPAAGGPRYVWLLRHPLGVAASLLDRYLQDSTAARRWWTPWRLRSYAGAGGGGRRARLARRWREEELGPALRRWRDSHERIERHLAALDPGRSTTVHYERLVREPARVVEGLCAWLGMAPDPAMLRPWEDLPDRLGWRIGDGKLRGTRAILRGRADAWRREFDEAATLDAPTRALMHRLGVTEAAAAEAGAGTATPAPAPVPAASSG